MGPVDLQGDQKLQDKLKTAPVSVSPPSLVSGPSPSPPETFMLHSRSVQLDILTMPSRAIYNVRRVGSSSQRWGLGSWWDPLLASYVTPTNRSYAFKNYLKSPNFVIIGESHFQNWGIPTCSKLRVFNNSNMFFEDISFRIYLLNTAKCPTEPRTLLSHQKNIYSGFSQTLNIQILYSLGCSNNTIGIDQCPLLPK